LKSFAVTFKKNVKSMSIKSKTEQILNDDTARFFMPGHKGTLSFYDITEIDGADNLVCPEDEILAAQKNIADAYGCKYSFISVNGSSAAVMSAILSTCTEGKIILDRGCHISAINAVILGRCVPFYIYPNRHAFFGTGTGITKEQVENAISLNPDAKAILVTSPTYYGVCSDIEGICSVAHKNGIPVIVDAAHGAHFAFSDSLPTCAIDAGADIVIHSTHKTLNCLTQGAVLHHNSSITDHIKLKQTLNMLQTTSPSYLLMSSVEQSVYDAKATDFKKLTDICDMIRNESKLKTLSDGFYGYDKSKLVFNGDGLDKKFKISNIIIEMYDGHNAVLMPSIYNSERDFERLLNFVRTCDAPPFPVKSNIPKAQIKLMPFEAHNTVSELVSRENAIGRIAARAVYKNPPCMPVVVPGELITEENIDYIKDTVWCIK